MLEVEKVLQRSGMTLEEALSIKEDRAVLRVQRADTGSFILRLYQKEVPAYRELELSWHEGFPQVYRTYEEEGFFVVEEEDVEGVSLQEYLAREGKLPENRTQKLAVQLCRSLSFLHSLGYIHRDVKPEHIILTAEQKAVLIDLDASMGIQPEKKNDTMLIGTAVYAAPEQFGLTRSDQRADVYAMGILMNEMLTGKHPTVQQYRKGRLAKIIETCTKINPDDRFQSMGELEDALTLAAKSSIPGFSAFLRKKTVQLAAVGLSVGLVLAGAWILQGDVPAEENLGEDENDKLSESSQNQDTPESEAEGEQPAWEVTDPSQWKQMYKYDRMEPISYSYRTGAQSARYYTEDGTLIDQTYDVYLDAEIGSVMEWDASEPGWCVTTEGTDAGASGYLHAEKDGKHYVIEVQVLGEPMSAYSKVPDWRNFLDGYLQSKAVPQITGPYVVEYTYERDKSLTLYLAAMHGLDELQVFCRDERVTLVPYEGEAIWQGPVYELTFENPEGGDAVFMVTSNKNSLTFSLKEK